VAGRAPGDAHRDPGWSPGSIRRPSVGRYPQAGGFRSTSCGIVPEMQRGTPTSSRRCAACRARACCWDIASNRSGTGGRRRCGSADHRPSSTVPRWCLGISRGFIHSYGSASVTEHGPSPATPPPNGRKSTAFHKIVMLISFLESVSYSTLAAPYLSIWYKYWTLLCTCRHRSPPNLRQNLTFWAARPSLFPLGLLLRHAIKERRIERGTVPRFVRPSHPREGRGTDVGSTMPGWPGRPAVFAQEPLASVG